MTSLFNAANVQTRTVIVEALTTNPGGRLLPGEYIVMEFAIAMPRAATTVPMEAVRRDVDQKPFVWTLAVASSTGGKTIYTCVMHPEVQQDHPGKCPKCGMDLTLKNKSGKFTAHRVYVMLGTSDGRRAVVESGLQVGQYVLTRGHENLNEDTPVTPVEWGAGGPKTLPEASGDMSKMPGMNMGNKNSGSMGGMKMDGAKPDKMPGMNMGNTNDSNMGGMKMGGDDHSKMSGMDMGNKSNSDMGGKTVYTCPMHLEVRSDKPGDCPKCGMKLVPMKPSGKKGGMDNMPGMGGR